MANFDPRKLMEQAIDVMRQSTPEPRTDGKACPLVGAVLWKPDGTISTAHRGELRYGDHAEFTLLERKNRDQLLDGAILFATLEPCAPESRKPPKLGCAERIVLARIKQVWVGTEDPDPSVDRKGIKYLQDNGVKVQMFDRDLQQIIIEANKQFIEQAKERVAEVRSAPKAVQLSTLENAQPNSQMKDLSHEALQKYRSAAVMDTPIESDEFNRRLLQHGLLKRVSDRLVPTGLGIILFGKAPRSIIRQAGLLATIRYANGKEETKEFDGPLVLIPSQVEQWLKDKLPNVIDRSRMERQSSDALPFELVREAIVNALVHRDYDLRGAKCHLIVTSDTIAIKSPGGPVSPITLKQLQDFDAPMLSRNPELHYVFSRMGLAEERGLGLRTLKDVPKKYGLPLPTYRFDNPYLTLTLYRSAEGAARALPLKILNSLNSEERAGWEFLTSHASTTKSAYAKGMGFDDRKALRQLQKFLELGLVRRIGAGRSTAYEIVRN